MDESTSKRPVLTIFNIKSSAKVNVKSDFNLKQFQNHCEYKFNFECTPYSSFLVIRPKDSKVRYIVFRKKKLCDKVHVNITGSSSFELHDLSVKRLQYLFDCDSSQIIYRHDNISGSCNSVCLYMEKCNIPSVSLNKIANYLHTNGHKIKFNPEIYACIVLTFEENSLLFYSSGKLTLVGFSSVSSMIEASKCIGQLLINAVMQVNSK